MKEFEVVSVKTIPTGFKGKGNKTGLYLRIFNKYIEIGIPKSLRLYVRWGILN